MTEIPIVPLNIIAEEFEILNQEYIALKKRKAPNEEYKNNARRMILITHALIYWSIFDNKKSEEDKEIAERMLNHLQEGKNYD